MSTAEGESVQERLDWLEESRVRAAEGAARCAAKLREVDGHQKRQAAKIAIQEDALVRIAQLAHGHGAIYNEQPCAACIAQAALEGRP